VIRRVLVVAAVIRRGGAILVTRRKDDAERGGQWEFPGGKVEAGESEPAALIREIREELGCDVEVGPLIARHVHRYPDLEVELAFHDCTLPPGAEPRALGVAAMEWAERGALGRYDFCEADLPVLPVISILPLPHRGRGPG
jgi:8-oxo-dGTP diphosphatase